MLKLQALAVRIQSSRVHGPTHYLRVSMTTHSQLCAILCLSYIELTSGPGQNGDRYYFWAIYTRSLYARFPFPHLSPTHYLRVSMTTRIRVVGFIAHAQHSVLAAPIFLTQGLGMDTGIILGYRYHCTARFLSSFPLDGAQETLSQSDDMEILEELLPAKNQTVFLARKLGIPDHTVETIHKEQIDQKERLYHVIQEFLKQVEPRPTWRVILDALRNPVVNLPRLAETIERRHGFHTPASEPTSRM